MEGLDDDQFCIKDVCCAANEDDCCEANVGAIVGLGHRPRVVIAAAVFVPLYARGMNKAGGETEMTLFWPRRPIPNSIPLKLLLHKPLLLLLLLSGCGRRPPLLALALALGLALRSGSGSGSGSGSSCQVGGSGRAAVPRWGGSLGSASRCPSARR